MGQTCTKSCFVEQDSVEGGARLDSPDPVMYDLMRKSISATSKGGGKRRPTGQHHLLYKNTKTPAPTPQLLSLPVPQEGPVCPTRLLIRRRSMRVVEEGGGTHIYAIRYPEDTANPKVEEQAAIGQPSSRQEQCPPRKSPATTATQPALPVADGDVFTAAAMASIPRQTGE